YGPIIGKVCRKNDAVVLRVWVEPYLFSAIDAAGDPIPAGVKVERVPLVEAENSYYPGTYWVYDLEVPTTFDRDLRIGIHYKNTKPADINFKVEAADLPHPNKRLADQELHEKETVRLPLSKLSWFQRLKKTPEHNGAAFLVGSCHYPGSPFDEDLADSIFKSMLRHVDDSHSITGDSKDIDHVLLVGDQIYADATADAFDTRELRERFARRYREAFGAKYARRLLASVPTYRAIDDHEFEDNWPGDAEDLSNRGNKSAKDYLERFKHGRAAALAYQWSMSSRDGWPNNSSWRPRRYDSGLWYTFKSGSLPFFVMDTRTERRLREASISWEAAQLVGKRQFKALKDWLVISENRDKPKFIVSGSVLAPITRNFTQRNRWLWRNIDGWAGYPATWRKLVKYIVENKIQKVVFIAGDYHLSALAQLTLHSNSTGANSVTAYQIAASALFAPLPFANAKRCEYEWADESPKPIEVPFSDDAARILVEPYLLSTNSSHFLRLDVQPAQGSNWSIRVIVCDRNGVIKPEMAVNHPFTMASNVISWTV
ncbi:MAG: alkaline phosphatase D family protein, partial [Candidatus Binatia bacterium]